jgi:hypothetical protein
MRYSPLAPCLIGLFFSSVVLANHGPGASGGGSATISGETLLPGRFELSLREDYAQFEHFSRSAAQHRAEVGGDFDALDRGFITSAELAYGVTEDFQIGGSIGYYVGHDFRGADLQDDGSIETSTTNPDGFTDLGIMGKYRLLRGKPGNLSLIGGVVIPTGRANVALGNAERLSPTDQPGTGRWGIPLGLGYSRFLTPNITVDASVLYTYRFEKDGFKVGDRLDTGLALAYRLTDSIKTFPQYSVFAELNDVYLFNDRVEGENDPNSGSNTLYITPGFRVRFNSAASLTVAPSFPVIEDLNGDQGKVDFKLAITLSLSF